MTPAARAALRRALLGWYREARRDLPWRRTKDPYRVWVSEVMLQQTRVEAAGPYYRRFLHAFPTVGKLAAAPLDRVLKLWEGLGYYARARNLHQAARRIAARRGRFPASAAEWATLPGVGRYTAGAIASIALGERVPVVDGNVKRVLSRLYHITSRIDEKPTLDELWRRAGQLVPPTAPGDFNQALMELGARVCTPRTPKCHACPLARWCTARAAGVAERLPRKRPRGESPQVRAAAAVLRKNGRYLFVRRPDRGLLAGLWAWPACELRNGQSPTVELQAYLAGTLGLHVDLDDRVARVEHVFSHRRLRLDAYAGTIRMGRLKPHTGKWLSGGQLGDCALGGADRKVLEQLRGEGDR